MSCFSHSAYGRDEFYNGTMDIYHKIKSIYNPDKWVSLPMRKAVIRCNGADNTICSVGVGLHRAVAAARDLAQENISAELIDLRTVAPQGVHGTHNTL